MSAGEPRWTRTSWQAAQAAWKRGEGPQPPPLREAVPQHHNRDDARRAHVPAVRPPRAAGQAPPSPPVCPPPDPRDFEADEPTGRYARPRTDAPRLVAMFNDRHWPVESPSWRAIRRWHREHRPALSIFAGDLLDASVLGKHPRSVGEPQTIAPEIRQMVRECNELATECGELLVIEGNHDRRVESYLRGPTPHVTAGLRGLTLPELARAHGLDAGVRWFTESAETPDVRVAQFAVSHGHNAPGGKFGAGKHLAAKVETCNGVSFARGHNHRAQVFCHTSHGVTAIGIASPACAAPMDYAPNANWQFGMVVFLLRPPAYDWATPYVVICDDRGGFCWGDRYYAGDP